MPDMTEKQLHALAVSGATNREIAAALGRPMTTLERTLVDRARVVGRLKRKAAKEKKDNTADRVHRYGSAHNDIGEVGTCADPARRDACRLDLRLFLETYHAQTCTWPL